MGLSLQLTLFETGIKVVDLLTPYNFLFNETPGNRMRVTHASLSAAEYFRDASYQDVLLFQDEQTNGNLMLRSNTHLSKMYFYMNIDSLRVAFVCSDPIPIYPCCATDYTAVLCLFYHYILNASL